MNVKKDTSSLTRSYFADVWNEAHPPDDLSPQILFKPFLQSLGLHVESVRPSAMMKNFGGHLLLQGHLDVLKVLQHCPPPSTLLLPTPPHPVPKLWPSTADTN